MYAMIEESSHHHHVSSGGRLVTVDGRSLPLKETRLRADACSGLARVVLEQRFINPYDEPLSVSYKLPLPDDGAVSGFAFQIGGQRVVGEVDCKERARERFEEAIIAGHTAALLEQERSALFSQEVGNIPPRTEIVAELTVDQKLRWLAEGEWEWRFPMVVAPRYLGQAGRVADAARVSVDVADRPLPTTASMSFSIRDTLVEGRQPESTSHSLSKTIDSNAWRVSFAEDGTIHLDRDIVIHWPVARPQVGLSLDICPSSEKRGRQGEAYGLLTIVPPTLEANTEPLPRDLVVLIDTSGSMTGEPIEQAKRVVSALVDTLTDRDSIEMIQFSATPTRWSPTAVQATPQTLAQGIKWIRSLQPGGGTEMRSGIMEALRPLRQGSQRQVVLVTDGLIGFESEIIAAISGRLPAGCRLHTVGVGSAVNRSLTGPAARAGRGTEVILELGEDPEKAAARLVAHTDRPVVVDVEITGSALLSHAPERLPDLYAQSPVLVSLKLRKNGGELKIHGLTVRGSWDQLFNVPPTTTRRGCDAVIALYGREAVEDLETRRAAGERPWALDEAIENLGLDFQITTRLTSWFAVTQEKTVDRESPIRRMNIPQELPHGMSMSGIGLRPATPGGVSDRFLFSPRPPMAGGPAARPRSMAGPPTGPAFGGGQAPVMQQPLVPPPLPGPARPRAPSPLPRPSAPPPRRDELYAPATAVAGSGPYWTNESQLTIIVTERGGAQKRFRFDKPEVTIGRVQGNDIILPEKGVSKRHARLVHKDGRFIIVDLHSINGTYVNGRKITAPLVVTPGDKIYITDFILGIEASDSNASEGCLEGRIIIQRKDHLTVEFQVKAPKLHWSPGHDITVFDQQKRATVAELNASLSTRSGLVRQGMMIRLTINSRQSSLPLDPLGIQLMTGEAQLRIALR